MKDRYIKLKIETVVNKLLYEQNIIDKELYEQTQKQINDLLYEIKLHQNIIQVKERKV